MIYCTATLLLMTLGAFALERLAAWRGCQRRCVWAFALGMATSLPTVRTLGPHDAPRVRPMAMRRSSPVGRCGSPTRLGRRCMASSDLGSYCLDRSLMVLKHRGIWCSVTKVSTSKLVTTLLLLLGLTVTGAVPWNNAAEDRAGSKLKWVLKTGFCSIRQARCHSAMDSLPRYLAGESFDK
jgi:hypothetical protein